MGSKIIKHLHYRNTEAGMYLIVVAFAAIVFVAFIALTIGMGFVATGKTRMQAVADLVSTAALEAYLRPLEEPSDNEEADKRSLAHNRAEDVLERNRIPGMASGFGSLLLEGGDATSDDDVTGSSGTLQFGVYYEDGEGQEVPTECDDEFPCFVAVDDEESASAVRLILKNQSDNPLMSRAAGLLGKSDFFLEVDSLARIRETCTAYVLDVSLTSTRDEYPDASIRFHRIAEDNDPSTPAFTIQERIISELGPSFPDPIPPSVPLVGGAYRGSLFAYRASCIINRDGSFRDCNQEENFFSCAHHDWEPGEPRPPWNPDLVHWCSMRASRGGADPEPAQGEHFRSDYLWRGTFDGDPDKDMLVARFREDSPEFSLPRPLDSFMRAFNAGLRLVHGNANADRALLMAFTGEVHNRIVPHPRDVPGGGDPKVHFTRDLGFLIQITNMLNIGQVGSTVQTGGYWGFSSGEEIVPNFLDKGFFPSYLGYDAGDLATDSTYSATNITEALWDAAEALVLECPERARKQIVLATDGRASCRFTLPSEWGEEPDSSATDCSLPDNDSEWEHYIHTENNLLQNLLPRLQEANIALTTILSGQGALLEYENIPSPNQAPACSGSYQEKDLEPHCFLNLETAFDEGYGGYQLAQPAPFDPLESGLAPCSGGKSLFPCRSIDVTGYDGASFSFRSPPSVSPGNAKAAYQQQRFIRESKGPKFGRPLNLFGHLAAKTGGIICPLLEPGTDPDFYINQENPGAPCTLEPEPGKNPCVLRNSIREFHDPGRFALEYIPKTEQAARCIERAIGKDLFTLGNPVKLVE